MRTVLVQRAATDAIAVQSQSPGFIPTALQDSLRFRHCPYSAKEPRGVERHVITHHVITGPSQLMRERFHGEDRVTLSGFLFVEAPGRWQELRGKVRRFKESPGKIRIAVLHVAFPFFLLVAGPFAVHAASIRSEVPDVLESLQISGLKHNGPGNHFSDAVHRAQHLVVCSRFERFQYRALDALDLLGEQLDGGAMGCDAELVVSVRQLRPGRLLLADDDLARQLDRGMSPKCALSSEHMCRALTHEAPAYTQEVTHTTLRLRIDVAGG